MNLCANKKILFVVLLFLAGCTPNNKPGLKIETTETIVPTSNKNCIQPIETFAYPVEPQSDEPLTILPQQPWIMETQLPPELLEAHSVLSVTRSINNYVEVWFVLNLYNPYLPETGKEVEFAVYRPTDKSWEFIPAEIENTGNFIYTLFVAEDGSLWGENVRDIESGTSKTPLFSKYNDIRGFFELVPGTEGMPALHKNGSSFPDISRIQLGADGLFWIFAHYDAVYSYDPNTGEIKRHLEIPDIAIADVTLSPDKGFYFSEQASNAENIYDQKLYRYFPEENYLEQVLIRLEPWPLYTNILLDHNGRLWLGNLGWLEPDGTTWYQIHRSPEFIANILWSGKESRWKPGYIMLESSDGWLWFHSDNGMVSLDPKKGEWCWFTTYQSNIVEDSEHNLWMIADGKLYKYPLAP